MGNIIKIRRIEDLQQFLNEKGIAEIVIRNKNQKFRLFQKISLDQVQQSASRGQVEKAIELLNKNNQLAENSLKALNGIAKLSTFNLILNGLNLCATCVGFAIMYEKLDKISAQINEIVMQNKDMERVHINYKFSEILSEHTDMLDCRKTQNYYSVEKMRLLVDREYNVLELLTEVFLNDISSNRETLIFSMLSLASMLAASLKYFDEAYYFKYKEAIGDGDKWHLGHDNWMSVFDKMSSDEFTKIIQDYGFFDMGLNTVENDCFYLGFYNQVKSLKQEIIDNQTLIVAVSDPEIFKIITEQTIKETQNEIENAFKEAGADIGLCDKALKIALA